MFTKMKSYLASPAFADDQLGAYSSRAFKTLLLNTVVVLALAAFTAIFVFVRKQQTAIQLVLYLLILLTSWLLAQRSRTKLASALFVAGNWVIYTVVVLVFSVGINTITPIIFVSLAVTAGVLLGPRAAVLVAILSALAGLGKIALDASGYVAPYYHVMAPTVAWVMLVFGLTLAVIPLNLVLRGFVEALAQVRQELEERRNVEAKLRESQKELQSAKEFAENLIQTADTIVVGLDLEGNITIFNDAAQKITGYRIDELANRNWFEVLAPRDRYPEVWREFSRLTTGGLPRNFQNPILTKSGEERYIVWQNNDVREGDHVVGIISFGIDITERKLAEERVEMLKHSIDVHCDGAYWMDSTNKFVYVNEAGCKALGYSREELMGKSVFDVNPKATPEVLTRVWEQLRNDGFRSSESVHRRKDGSEFPVETMSSYVSFGGKEYNCGFARDITERKRLEGQLRQAQKMEAVGQLAGGVAHDFNNLLQVILVNADLVRSAQAPDTPGWDEIDEVRKAAERAADLTRQLLAFSRRQVIQPVNMNLNDLIQGVLKMLRRVIGEHIELQFIPGDDLGTVHVDKGQIEQVLMNLCVNARDAMARGGNLTIETGNATVDTEYRREHPWAAEGRYVLMSVTDTGRGMDAATRARIFEPFFTTKGLGQGTGLGLATVYGIVKQHNGLLHVYSEPGMGTIFKVYLPLVDSPAEEAGPNAEPPPEGGTETILVAEDEPSVLKLVEMVLRTAGYAVLTACDGNEALRVFDEHSGAIDMAVLDVMMPGLSGREVIDQINAKHSGARKNLPFLFSSGYNENAIHTDFVIHEGLRLIQKPYRRTDLLREVRKILDEAARPVPDSAKEKA